MTAVAMGRRGLASAVAAIGLMVGPLTSVGLVMAAGSPPTNVAASSPTPPTDTFQATSVARDPVVPGRLAVAYQEGTKGSSCYLALSDDNGQTWSDHRLTGAGGEVPQAQQFTQTSSEGYQNGRAACLLPYVAYAPDGSLYYLFQTVGEYGNDYLLTSPDGGRSFASLTAIDASPVDQLGHRADGEAAELGGISVDPSNGDIHVIWMHANGHQQFADAQSPFYYDQGTDNDVLTATSRDHGKTFLPSVRLTPPTQFFFGDQLIASDGVGHTYAVWSDTTALTIAGGTTPPAIVYAAVSADRGVSFGAPVELGTFALNEFSCYAVSCLEFNFKLDWRMAAAAGVHGQAYVQWWDRPVGSLQHREFIVGSADGGKTWSPPAMIGVPTGASSHEQWQSAVSVAPNGRVDVAFYDLPADNSQDVYVATSTDGGSTFGTPRKLTDLTTDASNGGNFGHPPPAMTSSDAGLTATWSDPRRGGTNSGHMDAYVATTEPNAAGSGGTTPPGLPSTGGNSGAGTVGAADAAPDARFTTVAPGVLGSAFVLLVVALARRRGTHSSR